MGAYAGGGRGPHGFSRAKRAALAAAIFLVSLPQSAAAAAPAAPVWSVDRAASRLSFHAVLAGQLIDGVFSLNTASAITGQPLDDEVLPTAGWLWTRRFPKAQLVTQAITQLLMHLAAKRSR